MIIPQSNYKTKAVNVYVVYDLNNWPKYVIQNFEIKNCLFGATNIVKNSDKHKYVYTGYRVTFDGGGLDLW